MKIVRALSALLGISLPLVATEPSGAIRTVTIAAVGDTMVGSVFPTRAALPPAAGQRVFERVRELERLEWRPDVHVPGHWLHRLDLPRHPVTLG